MNVEEAAIWLKKCLRHRGFNFNCPDPLLGWQTFKSFAVEPIESDGRVENEGLWFEMGDGNTRIDSPAYFDFVRQFFKYEGEAEWAQQITLHFTRDPHLPFGVSGVVAASKYANLAAFFEAVESSELFRKGIAYRGWSCEVRLDDC